MQHSIIHSIQKRSAICVMAIALLFGMISSAPSAQAQTTNDLQAQIAQLMQLVQSLQAQVNAMNSGAGNSATETGLEGGFTDRNLSVGAEIQTTDSLKVRTAASANGALIAVQNPFSRGTVIGGPRFAEGYTWWQIAYENGRTGWSAENWLRSRSNNVPPGVPVMVEDEDEEDLANMNDIEIDLVDAYTEIINTSPNLGEWGRFVIEFEITAADEDIIVSNSLYGTYTGLRAKKDHQVQYTVLKNGRAVPQFSGYFSSMQPGFRSDAEFANPITNENKNENYFVVEAGDTEEFTIDITMTVAESANYQVQVVNPITVKTESGETVKVNFTASEFRSPNLYIEGEDSVVDDVSDSSDTDALQATINDLMDQIGEQSNDVPTEEEVEDMSQSELQAQINSLLGTIAALNGNDVDYDLDIESPRTGSSFKLGDTVTVSWDQDDLNGERGVITIEGGPNNIQRHIKERVNLSDGRVRVVIPADDRYLVAGEYELKLWVSYIKDGDPRGVSDTIDIKIVAESSVGTYQGYMNGRLFITTRNIPRADALINCRRNAANNPSREVRCTWNGKEIYKTSSMTTPDEPVIEQTIMEILSQMENDPSATSPNIQELYQQAIGLADQLTSTKAEFSREIEDVYQELIINTSDQGDDFWSVSDRSQVYMVGAYEGTYPDGERHSFGYHPQGAVTVNVPSTGGLLDDTLLVLTAYEPVVWNLQGDGLSRINRIFLSGYYDQEVTGVSDDVEIVQLSHEGGDREYFYFYRSPSANLTELQDYLETKTGVRPYPLNTGYSLDEVTLSWKG